MSITPLARISVDDPGSPIPVDGNFQLIENYVNTQLLNKDGSVAVDPGSVLTQETDPTQDSHVANKRYVDNAAPTGVMQMYAGATAPTGWAFCDGRAESSTDPAYQALFAVIGTTFGDPGSGNFNLPDMRQRMPVGKGTDTEFDTIGNAGGDENGVAPHTHKQTAHTHSTPNHTHGAGTLGTQTKTWTHSHGITDGVKIYKQDSGGGSTIGGGGTAVASDTHITVTYEHSHNITGSTGSGNGGETGTGTSNGTTDPTGSTGTDKGNYAPYLTLNFIIKL